MVAPAGRSRGAALSLPPERSPLNPAAAGERAGVPAREAGDLDHVAGVWRVDELAAADVDPDVARAGEEDQVARLELAHRHRHAHAVLDVRAVRERDADLCEDVHHEAGAVEPAGSRAAPD